MVKQSISKEQPGGPPPIDESWWTALLAEEEKPAAPITNGARQSSKTKTARQQDLNWQRASTIYEQDETISLRVSGFNRGGLLVDGEDLQDLSLSLTWLTSPALSPRKNGSGYWVATSIAPWFLR
jgi:small subunit ribosomal protein S1